MAKLPKRIPDYDLSKIEKRRRKINEALWCSDFYYNVLDAGTFDLLMQELRRALNLKVIHEGVLRESLMDFADVELTGGEADKLALRIAGGFHDIKRGEPVRPFTGLSTEREWAPVEIAEMRLGRIRNNKLYLDMTCMVMAGTAVGQEIKQQIPARFAVSVLAVELGWPKFKVRPTHSELVKTWFFALLGTNKHRKLQIIDFGCAPHQKAYNKKLRDQRNGPCLKNYRHQCRSCPVGYSECAYGTHRYSWLRKECPQCKQNSIYDPSDPGAKVCLRCSTRGLREFWAQERRNSAGG